MPTKVQNFARRALEMPVTVNVGRAGAVNLDVIQKVVYVNQEAKNDRLLQCLWKTAPPVIIFCENMVNVIRILNYLYLKGFHAVGIYEGSYEEKLDYAISSFKASKKDVLVATDVASKGLDFPDVQHVINYDMPADIGNYVDRIRRCGKMGRATTFIDKNQSQATLLDLKNLLQEAKQKIPPVLAELDDPMKDDDDITNASGVRDVEIVMGLITELAIAPN